MKKMMVLVGLVMLASVVTAAPIPNSKVARFGGLIERPDKKKGAIAFVNTQTTVATSNLASVVEMLASSIHAKIELKESSPVTSKTATDALLKLKLNAGIFVVEDKDLPEPVLVAPDSRWAIVNVAALNVDSPSMSFVVARTRKEMVRAFVQLCGGASSQYEGTISDVIVNITDLDKIAQERPTYDVLGRVRKFLPQIGIDTRGPATYQQAVREGWAPAPTNDVQRAIWKKFHDLPSNPIKIKYNRKKGE